jgi:competence protein ComEC
MFLLLAVAQIASLNLGRFTSFWFALSVSLLVTPWASGYAGFWYSFLAVAVLLLLSQRSLASAPGSLLAVLLSIRTQCVLLTALMPVSSQFMNTVSFVAPLANLIAIPIMTGLVLPPALLAVATFLLSLAFDSWMLEAMSVLVLGVAEWGLRLLVQVLFFFAELNGAAQLAKLPLAYAVLLGFTILMFISGTRLVDSGLVLIALLPLLQPKISRPAIGEVKIWVIDGGRVRAF